MMSSMQWPDLSEISFVLTGTLSWVLSLLGLSLLGLVIYRSWFHPLAAIPGPRLAALSNIWQAYYARNGCMLGLGKTLHVRYGPIVRVGPNEVWFDSPDAFRSIYGQSSYRNRGRGTMH